MVLRVKPTPTRLPNNSLYTPMNNTLLHSISSVCQPWGMAVVGYDEWPVRVQSEEQLIGAHTKEEACVTLNSDWSSKSHGHCDSMKWGLGRCMHHLSLHLKTCLLMMKLDLGKLIYQVLIHTFGRGAWPISVRKRCHTTGACIMFAAFERSRKRSPCTLQAIHRLFHLSFLCNSYHKAEDLEEKVEEKHC